jgi:hypothetical protein
MNNACSKLKVCPVLFNCMNTGALDIRMAYRDRISKNGTVWRFTPPGCQFRDGLAELRVNMMKKTLCISMQAGN